MVKAPSQLILNRGGILKEGSQITSSSATSSFYKKKYKSWRKGKSTKHSNVDTSSGGNTGNSGAKNHGSLKQQLRGLQRLQQKKMKDRDTITLNHHDEGNDTTLQQQEQELQEKIDALQEQIQMRTISEKERNNAKKSHKLRFIDRQRTTRLYQQYMKQLSVQQLPQQETTSNDDNDLQRKKIHDDLFKLALDQIYIAHFPLDRTSYVSIFNPISMTTSSTDNTTPSVDDITPSQQQQQRRTVMNNRLLHKMATQRQCIIERLYKSNQSLLHEDDGDGDAQNEEANHSVANARSIDKTIQSHTKRIQPVSWIHPSQYERIQHLTTWSTQLERTTFNITIVNNSTSDENRISSLELDHKTTKNTDERFHNVNSTFNTTQQLLLQEQERIERELSTIEEEENIDEDEGHGSSSEARRRHKPTASTTKYINDESDSSDDYDEEDNGDEMDDDVDPLKRSAAATVVPLATSKRNDDTTRNIRQHNNKTTSDDDADHDHENDNDDSSESSDSEQSDDSDSVASSSMKKIESKSTSTSTRQDEVLAMATNLRKLASQKEKASLNNTNQSGSNMEEEDDFFVALDDNDNNDEDNHISNNVNVFANAKRDVIRNNHNNNYNGIGDKSQGWATQKQLPGQFRKKQRRR